MSSLRITEIYASIQGESSYAGLPCVFVRLTGCPLRCRWCDTAYAFSGGQDYGLDQIVQEIDAFGIGIVELTGGEPLAQNATPKLINRLVDKGYTVLVETGGSESIVGLNAKLHIVMDLKCPDSGMSHHNRYENLEFLKPSDEIKFVCASQADFDWAVSKIRDLDLERRFSLLMSPAFGLVKPKDLAQWMLDAQLKARLNLQQHKFIWSPRAKGV